MASQASRWDKGSNRVLSLFIGATMPESAFYGQEATMPEAIPPVGASWNQEGASLGSRSDHARQVHFMVKKRPSAFALG
jgi:hypothetical protein